MKRCILTSFVLCFSILVCLTIGPAGAADKKAKEGKITGTVHMIDKDKSTLVVMKGNSQRQVIYNSDTKWMHGTQASNKPSSLDEPQGELVDQLRGHVRRRQTRCKRLPLQNIEVAVKLRTGKLRASQREDL